ncbi:hypothetical protein NDU88_002672 [Pleurodeles waltl]|uniref:Uncharacterized protein n=1 Tax=Pleurodeles waltl TaxID=8319 RepID=A0AAV7RCP9_PLEWA|nr:hypothetical protein NDU88_002672 [Pleurodeles waltl]
MRPARVSASAICSPSCPLREERKKMGVGAAAPSGAPPGAEGNDGHLLHPPALHSRGPATSPAPPHAHRAPGQGTLPQQASSRPRPPSPLTSCFPRCSPPEAPHRVMVATQSMVPVSSPKRDRF